MAAACIACCVAVALPKAVPRPLQRATACTRPPVMNGWWCAAALLHAHGNMKDRAE